MTYSIYIIKNTVNSKVYIGQTRYSIEKRFSNHKSTAKANNPKRSTKIGRAMRKHKIENFYVELLCNADEEFIDIFERAYIKEYDAIKNGYNIEIGGNKNKHLSDDTKQKISKTLMGHYQPPASKETRIKMSEAKKGLKPWLGKTHSKETKLKIVESRRKFTDEQEFEIIKIYKELKSSRKVAEKYNVSQITILNIVKKWESEEDKQKRNKTKLGVRRFTDEQELEIFEVYKELKSTKTALIYKVNFGTICKIVKRVEKRVTNK